MNSHFELTSKRPDLDITAVNPTGKRWRDTDGIEVEIGLFYRLHDDPSDSWKAVPNTITLTRILRSRDSPASAFAEKEDDSGRATLWVSADDNDLFRSGRRYEFELRSQCYKNIGGNDRAVGETRSGPRLGVVDFKGPRIMSWKTTQLLDKPTLGFPICSLIFDKGIDCSRPSFAAVVT